MNFDDLPASELTRIDAVCMDFENRLRTGELLDIDVLVQEHGGPHTELLQRELQLVRDEVENKVTELPKTVSDALLASSQEAAAPEPLMPTANTAIGPFLIQGLIGRGGMGMVFSALDQRLDRKVAIKMLAVQTEKREALTTRFDREAKALAALSHPNIVELFDVGVFNGLPYAVMEFLDGELLRTRLRDQALNADQVRSLGASIADALAAAHRADVVHRDLKPDNIMLVQLTQSRAELHDTTVVKLFDFGLSRAPTNYQDPSETPDLVGTSKPPEDEDSSEDQNSVKDANPDSTSGRSVEETGAGVIMGTPGYMAPEQVRGEKVTPAADIFSLGCVLFEAFYGQLPFEGRTHAKRFAATLHEQPSTDQERRSTDPALAELIDECLQKEPAKRPGSAAEIAIRLRARPGTLSHSPVSNHRRTWLIAASGAIAVAASSPFWFRDASESQRNPRETLSEIQSLAVLSITDGDLANSGRPTTAVRAPQTSKVPPPIGQSPLGRGEEISALLVHELTRLSDLSIPRFRPLSAETPEQFRSIGKLLEVDALMTGEIRTVGEGPTAFAEIDLQIISATTGKQIWGNRLQSDAPDNLLLQSRLVSEIAAVIGKRLTSTVDEPAPPTLDSFRCLVDAQTRSDPDSRLGLEMALQCF
ncbi:MAG: protein kinase, partial [Rubripirellula sp.]|nr:protein kinase [Rubripirellula sp.]